MGWPTPPSGYREGGSAQRWRVRWVIDAAAVGHLVTGTYMGLAYDGAAPADTATLFPQQLVTLAGAVLPLQRG